MVKVENVLRWRKAKGRRVQVSSAQGASEFAGFVSKKVMRRTLPKFRRLQARLMLSRGKRVSEAQLIDELAELGERHQKELEKKEGKISIFDYAGFIKTAKGTKFNAEDELDKVVYGA